MKKIILFILLPAFMLTGCRSDDDNSGRTQNTVLTGAWSLVNVSGGLLGQDADFAEGWIVWTFNSNATTVSVVNNNPTDSNTEDFFETGVYTSVFTVADVSVICNESLEVADIDLGCVSVSGETMTMVSQASDGYLLTFKKVMQNQTF